ncbi:uncharacterized protein LOC119108187 [Pollicipes pollicipes]|uniref:uncharacterized protein LOC119108187 n=1 Tax=Pollicipes pollicipes TaxID=41117 RepID=UPI001885705C|nr:uncharacterized protein LOC119108187 [Pollicipes pollicipes]
MRATYVLSPAMDVIVARPGRRPACCTADLHRSDHAFPSPVRALAPADPGQGDPGRVPAFAQLLQGYRNCLTLIRIHPSPVITFHKASFLGQRSLVDCAFTARLLDCMFFTAFITERGPPWRPCDIFDEVYCGIADQVRQEAGDRSLTVAHLQELAQHLYNNESPSQQPYVEKIPRPTEGSFRRIHQPVFPTLQPDVVHRVIEEGRQANLKQSVREAPGPTLGWRRVPQLGLVLDRSVLRGPGAGGLFSAGLAPGRERKLLRTCRRRSGAVVKHAAHKEKPVHLVQRRNAPRLSKVVPLESRGKRISKVKTLHKAIEYIDHLRQLLAADDVSRGHVNGATLDSSGDKENSWCAPPQVYADDYYPPQPHAYSMQYTIMTDYTPGQ